MDDVAWTALALSLTLVGGIYTYLAYRRRGLAAGLRGAALTLLPLAAYLTDTLRMFTRIGQAVTDWATGLVFSPVVWLGVVVAGLSVLLVGASRLVERRGPSGPSRARGTTRAAPDGRPAVEGASAGSTNLVDDDLAEIEAILRNRGIS
ncbi:MAG: hypothetical protein WB471_07470 [Nocardioides sp.]